MYALGTSDIEVEEKTARLARPCETYLVWQRVCSKISQRQLEFTIFILVREDHFDGDRHVW